jgi:NAD-dependent dihydropyrimidine dehydrogenase PreA subunit
MKVNEQEHAIVIDEEKCIGCGICVDFCNVDAIAVNDERGVLEVVALEDCIECHSCQQNCPEGAIMVFPQVEDSLRNL